MGAPASPDYWETRYKKIYEQLVALREQYERDVQAKDAQIRELTAEIERLKSGQLTSQFEGSMDLSQSHVLDLASSVFGGSFSSGLGLAATLKNGVMPSRPSRRLERIPSVPESEFTVIQDHLFEEFFMLGLRAPDTKESKPQVLFQYPRLDFTGDSVQARVIPDFCYPLGCTPYPLQITNSGSALNELLYGREALTRSANFFVFTLKAEGETMTVSNWDEPNADKGILYGVCLLTDDLIVTNEGQWIYPKCLCLLSYHACFELHFQVLTELLAMERVRRMNVVAGNTFTSGTLAVMVKLSEDLSDEEVALLCSYHRATTPSMGSSLRLSLSSFSAMQYQFPESRLMDISWCCPLLFTALSTQDLLTVLSAVMLEKSIVFLSANKGLLTSCV